MRNNPLKLSEIGIFEYHEGADSQAIETKFLKLVRKDFSRFPTVSIVNDKPEA